MAGHDTHSLTIQECYAFLNNYTAIIVFTTKVDNILYMCEDWPTLSDLNAKVIHRYALIHISDAFMLMHGQSCNVICFNKEFHIFLQESVNLSLITMCIWLVS